MLASIIPGANVRAVFLLPRRGSPQRFQFGVWPLGSGPCHFPLCGRHPGLLGTGVSANTPYCYPIRSSARGLLCDCRISVKKRRWVDDTSCPTSPRLLLEHFSGESGEPRRMANKLVITVGIWFPYQDSHEASLPLDRKPLAGQASWVKLMRV